MDAFKIILFESERKLSFPGFKTLTRPECQNLINKLSEKYNLVGNDIALELSSRQTFYEKAYTIENFNLMNTLADLGIKPMTKVIINWFRFQRLDEFKIDDLTRYFDDIWFPGSDDIDVFDDTLNWILSVRHDGCISFITNP